MRVAFNCVWGFLGVLILFPRLALCDAMFGMGQGGFYQLGDGIAHNTMAPSASSALSAGVGVVSSGADFGFAVQNGNLYGFGYNNFGQVGVGHFSVSAIQFPTAIAPLMGNVTAVSAGYYDALAIQNGAAFGWGVNENGEAGVGNTAEQVSPVAIPSLSSGVTQVAAGTGGNGQFSLALKGGTVYAFGSNGFGQLGNGNTTDQHSPVAITSLGTTVTAVAAGGFGGMALKGGAVNTWGLNSYGQLGNGTTGNGQTVQSDVPVAANVLTSGVTAIAAGAFWDMAIKNGHVYTWGFNGDGELGMGNTNNVDVPTQVPGLSNIVAVAGGSFDSYALSSDGSLWVWGSNGFGELGLGDQNERLSPTHLLPPTGYQFTGVSAGVFSALVTEAPVPEPTSVFFTAGGLLCLRRRRK